MPQTLSITDAPDDVVERLRARAARHHHSLEAELLAILKEAAAADAPAGPPAVLAEIRRLRLNTPSEAAAILRADRDGR